MMAERRMFSQKIVDSDVFLDMPLSAQALYFHLCMRADDDGFINNTRKIQRMIAASDDDLKLLIAKRFLIAFKDVVVVKHWNMHNQIRKDRYKPTQYKEEYEMLSLKDNGSYTEQYIVEQEIERAVTNWKPNDNHLSTICQPTDSIDKVIKDKAIKGEGISGRNMDYENIRDLFNSICVSYPKVKTLSDARKKTIKARLNTYSMEELKTVFEKAEASDFLKGKNNRNWMANFDWMLKDANFAKILDGNYDTKTSGKEQKNDAGGKTASNEKGYVQQLVEQGYTGEFEGF